VSDEELQEMIEEVDADGSGIISFDEFVTMIVKKMEETLMSDEKQVRKAFDVFDMDGSGEISSEDLQKALGGRCYKIDPSFQ